MLSKENLQVEERIRRQWWQKYRSIQEQCLLSRNLSLAWLEWQWTERKGLCYEYPRLPSPPRRETRTSIDETFSTMFPVDPSIRSFLYDGVSADHPQIDASRGRTTYLKLRQRFAPNEKYSFPILSSMEISWQIHSKCSL